MKAIVVSEFGGPEVLRYSDIPLPVPSGNEILVRNLAIGVNFVDTQHRAGSPYPIGLPLIPGVEGAGIVEAVGPAVLGHKVGDRVGHAGYMGGVYAQYSVVPEDRLISIPDHVDFTTAAAVLMQGMTAHALTQSAYPVRAGDHVLIHGAAGGVGLYLVEMAKQRGAIVIGTVSSESKAQLARQSGADHVILSTRDDFVVETQRVTGGHGVQVIYDSVGRTTLERNVGLLRAKGYLVIFGLTNGAMPLFDLSRLSGLTGKANRGSLFVTFATLSDYAASRDELVRRARDVLAWVTEGKIKTHIAETFPLAEASRAHQLLESRQVAGKLLLEP